MGAQPVEPVGQQFSDPPEAQHQALHPQERPVQMLHGDLEGRLRRGRPVGNGQLLPLEVVHQRQPAVLSLQLLGGTDLPCQQQLTGTETAEQRTGGQSLRLTVQYPVLPAERQRKDHHVRRCRLRRQIRASGHSAGPYRAPFLRQQPCELCLPPISADHAKGLVHPASPLKPWYARRGRR